VPLSPAQRGWAIAALLLLLSALMKGYAAAHWGLLADEAYYWVWSTDLALSYYDQPGGIAWLIAASTALLGDSELAIRAPMIGCGIACAALQGWVTGRPIFAAVWWVCVPPLAWLTVFATSDALLLFGWTLCVAAAIRGGRWWLVAALGAAVATYAKLSGVGVLPLALLGAVGRRDDSRYQAQAALLWVVLAAPLVAWNLGHGMVNFRFQLQEGLLHEHPPGVVGPFVQQVAQFGVVTPILYLAILVWMVRTSRLFADPDRSIGQRVAWSTSAPILLFFLACSPFAPAEGHWPAIAYASAGFGLGAMQGRLARLRDVGLGLGFGCSLILASHAIFPWLPLFNDPGTRLTEGRVLANLVGQWATNEGDTVGRQANHSGPVVFTERYQEAALIQYYTGLRSYKHPGCGRVDQYDDWQPPTSAAMLFVRPETSGYTTCLDEVYIRRSGPNRTQGVDPSNRLVGRWDIFEFESAHE
jgi:4-amino-4-deoxy-L-arabinose transferase-like glycosyltransferase